MSKLNLITDADYIKETFYTEEEAMKKLHVSNRKRLYLKINSYNENRPYIPKVCIQGEYFVQKSIVDGIKEGDAHTKFHEMQGQRMVDGWKDLFEQEQKSSKVKYAITIATRRKSGKKFDHDSISQMLNKYIWHVEKKIFGRSVNKHGHYCMAFLVAERTGKHRDNLHFHGTFILSDHVNKDRYMIQHILNEKLKKIYPNGSVELAEFTKPKGWNEYSTKELERDYAWRGHENFDESSDRFFIVQST